MKLQSEIMAAPEVAERLGIGKRRVYQLVQAGRLPGVKSGRRTLIPRRAFEAYIEQINRDALSNIREATIALHIKACNTSSAVGMGKADLVKGGSA